MIERMDNSTLFHVTHQRSSVFSFMLPCLLFVRRTNDDAQALLLNFFGRTKLTVRRGPRAKFCEPKLLLPDQTFYTYEVTRVLSPLLQSSKKDSGKQLDTTGSLWFLL